MGEMSLVRRERKAGFLVADGLRIEGSLWCKNKGNSMRKLFVFDASASE